MPIVSAVPSITSYGLSPALANRRSARPTNLDLVAANIDNNNSPNVPSDTVAASTTTNHIPNHEGEGVKYAQVKKLTSTGDNQHTDDGSQTPTESGESTTSGFDDPKGHSENDDESVMDRITRKSYYSKFQEKKKPKIHKANTKQEIDQQLAAAKARLMKEDTEKAVRDSLSPLRFNSPVSSPRTSVTSPPSWDIGRRNSRKSLPPEDSSIFLLGGQRGSSLQPDELPGLRRHNSVQPNDIQGLRRLPSVPKDDYRGTHRAPSVPLEEYSSLRRKKSIPPEEQQCKQKAPSVPLDDLSSKLRHKSIPPKDSTKLPSSSNKELGEESVQDAMAVAAAAGALAGEAAAVVAATDATRERGRSKSREPSVTRLRSSEPANYLSPNQDETRNLAREELSRRLTHLTRISGTSGLSGWNRGGLAGRGSPPAATNDKQAYRRTNTTGRLGEPSTQVSPASTISGPVDRPVYRRTNTMDIPPADARARPGSEYRRQLQDPARRYSAARWVP